MKEKMLEIINSVLKIEKNSGIFKVNLISISKILKEIKNELGCENIRELKDEENKRYIFSIKIEAEIFFDDAFIILDYYEDNLVKIEIKGKEENIFKNLDFLFFGKSFINFSKNKNEIINFKPINWDEANRFISIIWRESVNKYGVPDLKI